MKKQVWSVIGLLLLCTGVRAQGGYGYSGGNPPREEMIAFERESWDFGTIRETDGPVSHTFTLTNKGDKPFIMNFISTSCGCTAADVDKSPVMPGKSREIVIAYDPKNQSGKFTKRIFIVSDNRRKENVLTISGNVVPRDKNPAELYPCDLGDGMRASRRDLKMGLVPTGETHTQTIDLFNAGKRPATVLVTLKKGSGAGSVTFEPKTVPPDGTGQLQFTYDLTGPERVLGALNDEVEIRINGKRLADPVKVEALAIPNFYGYTAQELADAPVVSMPVSAFAFTKAARESILSHTFEIVNRGKSQLIVEKVIPGSDRIAYELSSQRIPPGGSGTVTLKMKTGSGAEKRSEYLTLIFNAPKNPVKNVRLSAVVE